MIQHPAGLLHHQLSAPGRCRRRCATIAGLGFAEIDLGALPGVCDHVPYVLDAAAVADVAATVAASGLRVRSINGDIGDLNALLDADGRPRATGTWTCSSRWPRPPGHGTGAALRRARPRAGRHTRRPTSTASPPSSSPPAHRGRAGVELWTESLHFHRLCCEPRTRRQLLADRLAGTGVGIVMDFSHIVASGGDPVEFVGGFGPRIAHVHIRDAVPGNINLSRRQRRRSTSPRPQGPGRRRLPPATSRWNSKPATSPTTNDPRQPPRPANCISDTHLTTTRRTP